MKTTIEQFQSNKKLIKRNLIWVWWKTSFKPQNKIVNCEALDWGFRKTLKTIKKRKYCTFFMLKKFYAKKKYLYFFLSKDLNLTEIVWLIDLDKPDLSILNKYKL